MFVIGAKIVLDFYGNDELRKKKAELEKLILKVRRQFNVSMTEVADFDDTERCVLGLALTATTAKAGRVAMKKVADFIDANSFARVTTEDIQILGFDG